MPDPLTPYPWVNVLAPVALLALVTLGLHFLLGGRGWKDHEKGLWPLVVGKDRRLSTSKVQLSLWTFAVVLALLYLLFFGKDFGALELQPEYLLLLGSPAAAALLAKTFTSTKVSNGTVEDTVADEPDLADVVTDDNGNTDLYDFQYFLFNLLLLAWFAVAMFRILSDPTRLADKAYFLPPLPLSLVGLTSVSAAGYVAKKGFESDPPAIRALSPSLILFGKTGEQIAIAGTNFGEKDEPDDGSDPANRVLLDGRPLPPDQVTEWASERIRATVPADPRELGIAVPAGGERGVDLEVQDKYGRKSEPASVRVALSTPAIRGVNPSNGADSVPKHTVLRATFSEKMDPETVRAFGAFTLMEQPAGALVGDVTVECVDNDEAATLKPNASLQANTSYTAAVKGGVGGVRNLAGSALAEDYAWTFTTGP